MIKKIIYLFFLLSIVVKVKSQNSSNIRTLDLFFLPGMTKENVGKSSTAEEFVTECLMEAKIEKIDSVSKVQFLLGNSTNPSEILSVNGDVIEYNGNYFIRYNGIDYIFTNYTCSLKMDLPRTQVDKIKLATFYLIDKLGRKTQELYFNVK